MSVTNSIANEHDLYSDDESTYSLSYNEIPPSNGVLFDVEVIAINDSGARAWWHIKGAAKRVGTGNLAITSPLEINLDVKDVAALLWDCEFEVIDNVNLQLSCTASGDVWWYAKGHVSSYRYNPV